LIWILSGKSDSARGARMTAAAVKNIAAFLLTASASCSENFKTGKTWRENLQKNEKSIIITDNFQVESFR